MRRCKWTPQEDDSLRSIVSHILGGAAAGCYSWELVAKTLGHGKNARQCRERWKTVLDPALNRGPWTTDEDDIFLQALQDIGKRWSMIARLLPGRTVTAVKNRYVSLCRAGVVARSPSENLNAEDNESDQVLPQHLDGTTSPAGLPDSPPCDSDSESPLGGSTSGTGSSLPSEIPIAQMPHMQQIPLDPLPSISQLLSQFRDDSFFPSSEPPRQAVRW
eukprot:c15884_g1_i3.p1 GENE.c15884_g1_i3~~c15884_g1_i3.p1  ORF type:complete len:218 (-),score=26.59 c15884_g1_i3:125-778(-)